MENLEIWRDDINARLEKDRADLANMLDRHMVMIGAPPGADAAMQMDFARATRLAVDVADSIRKSRDQRSSLRMKVVGAIALGVVSLLVPVVGKPVIAWVANALHTLTPPPIK